MTTNDLDEQLTAAALIVNPIERAATIAALFKQAGFPVWRSWDRLAQRLMKEATE